MDYKIKKTKVKSILGQAFCKHQYAIALSSEQVHNTRLLIEICEKCGHISNKIIVPEAYLNPAMLSPATLQTIASMLDKENK